MRSTGATTRVGDVNDSFTLRYLAGPKIGLNIPYFTADEGRDMIGTSFPEELPPHPHSTPRIHPIKASGHNGKRSGATTRLQLISEQGFPRAKWAGGS